MSLKEDRQDIKALADDDLVAQVAEAKDDLFKLRFKRVTGQLDDYSQLPKAKRRVARLLTELRAREIAAAEATQGASR